MKETLHSFGYGVSAGCDLITPESEEDIAHAFEQAQYQGRQIVLRGAGRSYGDASLGDGLTALSIEKLNAVINFDSESGLVEVQGGMSLLRLCQFALHHGFWPPVVSGTSRTTVSGAIAMNIHGKNQWKTGCFIEHVKSLVMIAPDGKPMKYEADGHGFSGIAGSLGLFGVVTRVTIQLKKVSSPMVRRQKLPVDNWARLFETADALTDKADGLTAWIDGYTDGAGTVEPAFDLTESNPPEAHKAMPTGPDNEGMDSHMGPTVLKWIMTGGLMKTMNAFKRLGDKLEGSKAKAVDLYRYNFQLDWLWDWDTAFLPGALVQFQSTVPKDQALSVFRAQTEMCKKAGFPPTLMVMKRHRPGTGSLDYLCDGWSLAIDIRQRPGTANQVRDLYESLAETSIQAGGRIYLAKDFLLSKEQFNRSMKPEELEDFKLHRQHFDPGGILSSGLARRLGL